MGGGETTTRDLPVQGNAFCAPPVCFVTAVSSVLPTWGGGSPPPPAPVYRLVHDVLIDHEINNFYSPSPLYSSEGDRVFLH